MFALPDQTHQELKQAAQALVELGVDQIAAYPLFSFSYARWPQLARQNRCRSYNLWQKRRMLRVLEQTLYPAGYERTSVWAFTRASSPRYCSVTAPLYLGLGASAGSYLRDIFYLNTFNIRAYIRALYGHYLRPLALLGLLIAQEDEITLTDSSAYWLHALQDLFSIDYVSKLWGSSQENPWPGEVIL